MTHPSIKHCLAAAAVAVVCGHAAAQSTAAPAASGSMGHDRNGSTAVPAGMPPGATSTRGDKAAAPNGSMATDPATGSTPGLPPGATSGKGDKASTPKGKGHGMSHDHAASGAGS